MTALTVATGSPTRSRIINVVRMQLVNRQTYIWIPLIILVGAFALTIAVYAILASYGADGFKYGGAGQAPLWYFMVVGVQALTLTFPFSQAMSVTRREFFLGTLLTAMLTSSILAVISVLGGLIERATNGWGMNGYFFALPWIWEAGAWGALLLNFTAAMLFFVIGFWAATIYKRWGGIWLTVILLGIGVVFVGLLWLAGRLDAWAEIGQWIGGQGTLGLTAWALLVTAVLAVSSFVALRRATP